MTWPTPLIAAADAAPRRPTALARLSAILTGAVSGHAGSMSMPPVNGTEQRITPDLTARAYRLHNRRKDAAERYLRMHRILGKGA